MKGILSNVKLLYFIFFVSMLNVIWFLYYNNYRCIILFASSYLVLYLINKNMIFVLGLSLILVNSLYLLKLVKKEGFNSDKNDSDSDIDEDTFGAEPYNKFKKNILNNDESDSDDEDSNYMQDKNILKKLKKLDPIILNTIENMNSVHIQEINKTINKLTNAIDP